jgi:hypothetical protein
MTNLHAEIKEELAPGVYKLACAIKAIISDSVPSIWIVHKVSIPEQGIGS